MAYVKYWDPLDWVNLPALTTPITAAALIHIETQYEEFTKLYDADTLLVANANDTPIILTVAANRIVGRAAGAFAALTGAQVLTIIDRVGKGNLEWAAGKTLKGAGAGADPTEVDGAEITVAETEVFNGNTPDPSAWTDLDLSGTVGANVAIVMLKFISAAAETATAFRKNGDADEHYDAVKVATACGVSLFQAIAGVAMVVVVATDAAGIVEWKQATAGAACTIDIIAFLK